MVFDIYSIVFCQARKQMFNLENPIMLMNEDYRHIVNVSPDQAIQNLAKNHQIELNCELDFDTVKPWIPYV